MKATKITLQQVRMPNLGNKLQVIRQIQIWDIREEAAARAELREFIRQGGPEASSDWVRSI